MLKNLLSLFSISLILMLLLSGCGEDEAVAPYDPLSTNPFITELKGDWLCTFVEESIYTDNAGKVVRVIEGESNDVFTFANTYYQKKSSPYRYFVYGASKGGDGKKYLHLEEYDKYYTLEVTTLNANSMVWKITFQGNSAKAVKTMNFRR